MATPRSIGSRYAVAWAESLEGALHRHQTWAVLCRYRCRLLLADIPKGHDRNAELKRRLQMWEASQMHELISRILGQQHTGQQNREQKPATDRRTKRKKSLRGAPSARL